MPRLRTRNTRRETPTTPDVSARVAAIRETVTELLLLIPALPAALEKDHAPGNGTGSPAIVAGTPCNTDVLSVMTALRQQIPAAERTWRRLLGDRDTDRPDLESIITVLPSYLTRFESNADLTNADDVSTRATAWLTDVRSVLGLNTPAAPIGISCPVCPGGLLVVTGSRGNLRRDHAAWSVDWARYEAIKCPACGSRWGRADWPFLGRLLTETETAA